VLRVGQAASAALSGSLTEQILDARERLEPPGHRITALEGPGIPLVAAFLSTPAQTEHSAPPET
jgi:hypothetical protein